MKLFRYLFVFLNLLAVAALLGSYLATIISPEIIPHLAYFGFIYPVLLILNLLFVVFWIIFRFKYAFISIIAIAIGFGILTKHVQISNAPLPDQKLESSLHLMSYNVQIFGLYNWTRNAEIRDSIIDFIQTEQPDVLCLQEYYSNKTGSFETGSIISKILGNVNVNEAFSVRAKENQSFGLATFMRYPIFNTGEIQFDNSNNLVQFTDFIFQSDTLRLYNIHLQSLHFDEENYKDLDKLQAEKINKDQLGSIRTIMHKFAYASKQRAIQSDSVKNHINQSPYSVILCGDFNDTPGSYAYNVLSKNLIDAFKNSGKGLDFSYQRGLLQVRIDHVLHDKSIESYAFETKDINYSDHFPVSCYLRLKDKKHEMPKVD